MSGLSTPRASSRYHILVVALLLLYTFSRLHDLVGFPPFLDEVVHIDWADDLYHWKPFTGASNGKLFGLWWMALFELYGDGMFFLARAATALFGVLGAATLFHLARDLVDANTGVLALLLYAFSPYDFFYARMALADPYVATWAMLTTWCAVRYVKQPTHQRAILCGLALAAALLAKATGVALVVIPSLAYLLLIREPGWRQRIKGLLLSYGAFALFWGSFYLVLRWRGYSYFRTATTVVGTSDASNLASRLWDNLGALVSLHIHYFSLPFLLLGIAAVAYQLVRRKRVALFLLSATLIPLGGVLAFAEKMSSRYFHFYVPLFILLVAVALGTISLTLKRRTAYAYYALPLSVVVVWGGAFALPFQAQYLQDPAGLYLPPLDRLEYVSSDAAGFAIPEVADHLLVKIKQDAPPAIVIGLFANCGALDVYIPESHPLIVECPTLLLNLSHQPAVAAHINALAQGETPVWVAYEESPFTSLEGITAKLDEEAVFARPDGLTRIRLFRASGGSNLHGARDD